MTTICGDCAALITGWIDAYQDFGPITRWRHYSTNAESERVRSAEAYRFRVEERAALIRQQVNRIRENCRHLDQEAAA